MGQSRLPQVPGGRFIQIHGWAVSEVGLAGAAVLGFLDFLDRNQSRPATPVATRLDISASLQGIVGRDGVDHALRDLTRMGWVTRSLHRLKNNPAERYKFSLNAMAIKEYLQVGGCHPEIRTTLSEIQDECQTGGQGDPKRKKEVEEEPPQEMQGGGHLKEQNVQNPNICEVHRAGGEMQIESPGILPALSSLIAAGNHGESTLNRLNDLVKNMPVELQADLLAVAQKKLPEARDATAYLMTLARNARDGCLTKSCSLETESHIGVIESNGLMSESEIACLIHGKTTVMKGDQTVAEIRNDGLYQGEGRFAISQASRIILAVKAGKLRML